MQISKMIHLRPEDELQEVINNQKTVRTSKLGELIKPLLDKIQWQEEALKRNVQSIRSLNDRAQKVEVKLKHKMDVNKRHVESIKEMEFELGRKTEVLKRASETIKMKDRQMQKANNELKFMTKKLEKSALNNHVLDSKNRMLEDKLARAKRAIAGMEMDMRVLKQNGGR